ncbi:flagellar hook-length control protein FliK [Kiloniella sp.]|uniref:flagellar hook-length control protein FliK n=1 Tax=Kiloniella sp. TaxID=1938587 RepID=UPI003A943605
MMNNYNIDINRAVSQQSTAKGKQAPNASQVFAEYLNSVGSSGKSAAVNPSLTRDNSLLGNIFNKAPWPGEREISFSAPKETFEDKTKAHEDTKPSAVEHPADEEDHTAQHASDDKRDSSDLKDDQQAATSDIDNNDAPLENKEVHSNENTATDSNDVAAAVAEPASQQAASQTAASLKQAATNGAANQGSPATVAPQQSAKPESANQGVNNAGVANVKVTEAEVTSRPMNSLTGSTSVSAQSSQDANTASANASAQDKSKGLATATAAQTVNGKTATPGQVAQAVLANSPGQNGNNANGQSQSNNGMIKADLGQVTNAKTQVQTGNLNFADTLASTSRTSKPAPTAPLQSTLRSMNVTPADQLSIHIRKAAGANKDSISIKLHPSELGRVDVKLEIVDGSTMKAMISAERPDTLDMLQRDSRMLEKALQEAGLKTDGQSLSFNLKQGGSEQNPTHNQGPELSDTENVSASDEDLTETADIVKKSSHDGDLDISI